MQFIQFGWYKLQRYQSLSFFSIYIYIYLYISIYLSLVNIFICIMASCSYDWSVLLPYHYFHSYLRLPYFPVLSPSPSILLYTLLLLFPLHFTWQGNCAKVFYMLVKNNAYYYNFWTSFTPPGRELRFAPSKWRA